nr:hypothetical protein GCM10025730_47050 [Promicromonospora thailandica]
MSAVVWGVLLTVLLVAWVVLDGAVQGVGATLLHERGKDGSDRRRSPARRGVVLDAVRPLRLPGEASLVAAVLVLVLAFPRAAGDLFRVAYPWWSPSPGRWWCATSPSGCGAGAPARSGTTSGRRCSWWRAS